MADYFLFSDDEILSTENTQCNELDFTEMINGFAECYAQLRCLCDLFIQFILHFQFASGAIKCEVSC